MQRNPFGTLGSASVLTLGGGGIGLIWGESSRDEAAATLRAAIDAGIDVIDTAPMYGQCEAIVGETFGGRLPAGVRITSKCALGSPPAAEVAARLEASLTSTLQAMRLERIDLFFLHSNICADDYVYALRPDLQDRNATRWSLYRDHVVPVFEAWRAQGRIGAWGITGTGVPATIRDALACAPRPFAVQAVTNLLDSAGAMRRYAEPAAPRSIIEAARANDVPVMGIRAVQAGALTAALDRTLSANHPERRDYERAAPFRAWCAKRGDDPAVIAHRYALAMPAVATLVLGVKNREELQGCLRAEAQGPLEADSVAAIDALGLREAAAGTAPSRR